MALEGPLRRITMFREEPWKRLLDRVRIEGQLRPVSDAQLDEFETKHQIKLPRSYREFCKVFGPGSLRGQICIHITVPETVSEHVAAQATKQSIEILNKEIWSTIFLDLDDYCPDPALIRKGLFFGKDIYTHHYFWNPLDITDKANSEFGVYVIFREMKIHRLADTFESFIYDICLDKGIPNHGKLDEDPPIFEAARVLG
jgi:hypothetical protein